MALAEFWTGKVHGTTEGNLFVELNGETNALTGTLHLKDESGKLFIYSFQGKFQDSRLELDGKLIEQQENVGHSRLLIEAILDSNGALQGQWRMDDGGAGTFFLFSQQQPQLGENRVEQMPPKLYTKRHDFGAVAVDRDTIITIAKNMQESFKDGKVFITISVDGNQQLQPLTQFEEQKSDLVGIATFASLYIQEPEGTGFNRILQVEFGPQVNFVMTQGGDQSWVIGKLELIKQIILPYQRKYMTNFFKKHFSASLGYFLLFAIVLFPSIESFWVRTALAVTIVVISHLINQFHSRCLPFATIYLEQKPKGAFTGIAPSVASWLITVTAGVAITLLATLFQGWLTLPFSQQ